MNAKQPGTGSVKQPIAGGTPASAKQAGAGSTSANGKRPVTEGMSASAKRRQKRRTSSSRRTLLIGAIASLVVAVVVAVIVVSLTLSSSGGNGDISGVVTYTNLSRNHVTGTVKYAQNPPVGGDHDPTWQNCGIYSTPLINEHAVHSMEHGAVWITYQPSLAEQDIQQLRSLARGHTYVLLSPYPGLPSPVVISAWGVQLKVTSASDARLAQFLTKYEQGPQTPELGAACSGGFGTPDIQ